MRLSTQVKPISYVKANAAQIIDDLDAGGAPIVVTKNGEAKAIVMSMQEFERREETLALLKLLAMAETNIAQGKTRAARIVIEDIRHELRDRREAA